MGATTGLLDPAHQTAPWSAVPADLDPVPAKRTTRARLTRLLERFLAAPGPARWP